MSDKHTIYRVQNSEGRGPFQPGITYRWLRDRDDLDNLIPWTFEFPGLIQRMAQRYKLGYHFGCGCRDHEQLKRWFTRPEYFTLRLLGFSAVTMEVDGILAESATQLVFERQQRLHHDVTPIELYP